MKRNIVYEKAFDFALKVIKLYKTMIEKNEYVLSKQVLRSATSIGANIKEALNAQSRKDFLSKMNIALKESSETVYWLELLLASGYLKTKELLNDCDEINKMLASIVKKVKKTL